MIKLRHWRILNPKKIKTIIDFSAIYNVTEEEGPVKRKRDDGFDENIVEVLGPPTKNKKYIRNHSISRLFK